LHVFKSQMKALKTLLLCLLLAAYMGAAVYQIKIILVARQPMIEDSASPENPTTSTDVVTAELKQNPINSKPLAHETRNLKKKQAVKENGVQRSSADSMGDSTREAIKSFQKTAELLTARLDPAVASHLDLELADSSLDP
jgi:hypothetical protein